MIAISNCIAKRTTNVPVLHAPEHGRCIRIPIPAARCDHVDGPERAPVRWHLELARLRVEQQRADGAEAGEYGRALERHVKSGLDIVRGVGQTDLDSDSHRVLKSVSNSLAPRSWDSRMIEENDIRYRMCPISSAIVPSACSQEAPSLEPIAYTRHLRRVAMAATVE